MNILAIDTSTQACSAALITDAKVFTRFEIAPMQHAKLILPMIDELLKEAQIERKDLEGLAYAAGPGSFTGVRIATGVIQGIGFALDLPIVAVSTLATLAQGAYRQFKAKNILVAMDARMSQVYWGVYQTSKQGIVKPVCQDSLVDPDKVIFPKEGKWFTAGNGWQEYKNQLPQHPDTTTLKYPDAPLIFPTAKDVLTLAEVEFEKGNTISAEEALPVYLRNKVVA
jgi:tRNA threonylcarbamoyladenosine biosynthesis protein TsaB